MRHYAALAFGTLLFGGEAIAQNGWIVTDHDDRWVAVDTSEHSVVHVDRQTISRQGSRVTVWRRMTYDSPRPAENGRLFISTLSRAVYDCAARTSHIMGWQLLSADDEVVDSSRHYAALTAESVAPDTLD